jgi:hypothetical protein
LVVSLSSGASTVPITVTFVVTDGTAISVTDKKDYSLTRQSGLGYVRSRANSEEILFTIVNDDRV